MRQDDAQTALVLSGGGAYGAFAVGVLKVLISGSSAATDYQPLNVDILSGTSVGAFNAAVIASQSAKSQLDSALQLESVWVDRVADRPGRCGNGIFRIRGNPADLLNVSCLQDPSTFASQLASDAIALGGYLSYRAANFLASSEPLESRAVALVDIGAFVDPSPYETLLATVVSEENIRNSPLQLRITATDWGTGVARYFSNSDFNNRIGLSAIMASTAIPGVFPPVIIDGHMYADGGVVENTPLNSAILAGATSLHVIYLDPNPSVIPLQAERNTLDTFLRVYYIMLATKLAEDIETARWINAGIDVVTQYSTSHTMSDQQIRDFVRAAGQFIEKDPSHYRRLTIHRYFPERSLGGDLGMLNFGVDAIIRMIEDGERAALIHNCKESGCVL